MHVDLHVPEVGSQTSQLVGLHAVTRHVLPHTRVLGQQAPAMQVSCAVQVE